MEGYEVVTVDEHKVGKVVGESGDFLIVEQGALLKSKHALPREFAHVDDAEQHPGVRLDSGPQRVGPREVRDGLAVGAPALRVVREVQGLHERRFAGQHRRSGGLCTFMCFAGQSIGREKRAARGRPTLTPATSPRGTAGGPRPAPRRPARP